MENNYFLEYKAMNTLPATNGTLAPSLTTSGALATVPLLTDGLIKFLFCKSFPLD